MDKKGRLIYQLLDFEKFVGTDHFSKGIREIVRRYSQITLTDNRGFCNITAEFNYKEVPEDEILALINSSSFSLKTIETVLSLNERAYTEVAERNSLVTTQAVSLFRGIGIQVSYSSPGNPHIECTVPEVQKGVSIEELETKVSAFVVLCKLHFDYPLVFSRYAPLDDEPTPLHRAFTFVLSLIEASSGATTLMRGAVIAYTTVIQQYFIGAQMFTNEFDEVVTPSRSSWDFVTKSDVPYTELDIQLEHLAYRYGYNKENLIDLRSN